MRNLPPAPCVAVARREACKQRASPYVREQRQRVPLAAPYKPTALDRQPDDRRYRSVSGSSLYTLLQLVGSIVSAGSAHANLIETVRSAAVRVILRGATTNRDVLVPPGSRIFQNRVFPNFPVGATDRVPSAVEGFRLALHAPTTSSAPASCGCFTQPEKSRFFSVCRCLQAISLSPSGGVFLRVGVIEGENLDRPCALAALRRRHRRRLLVWNNRGLHGKRPTYSTLVGSWSVTRS